MEGLIIIAVSASAICTIIAIIAMLVSLQAIISVKAMEKSTHSVQMVPIDKAWDQEENSINFDDPKDMAGIEEVDRQYEPI